MPFQSEKQRRYLHANHPEIAKRWERDYANGGITQLVQPGPGRPGYGGPHDSYEAGQSYSSSTTKSSNTGGGDNREKYIATQYNKPKKKYTPPPGEKGGPGYVEKPKKKTITTKDDKTPLYIKKKKKKKDLVDKTLETVDIADKFYRFGTTFNPLQLYKTNPYIFGGSILKGLYDKNKKKKSDASEISTTLNFEDPWRNEDLVYNETTGNFEDKLTGEIVKQSLPDVTPVGLNEAQTEYLDKVAKKGVVGESKQFFTYDKPKDVKTKLQELDEKSEKWIGTDVNPDKIVSGDPTTYATEKDVKEYLEKTYPGMQLKDEEGRTLAIDLATGGIANHFRKKFNTGSEPVIGDALFRGNWNDYSNEQLQMMFPDWDPEIESIDEHIKKKQSMNVDFAAVTEGNGILDLTEGEETTDVAEADTGEVIPSLVPSLDQEITLVANGGTIGGGIIHGEPRGDRTGFRNPHEDSYSAGQSYSSSQNTGNQGSDQGHSRFDVGSGYYGEPVTSKTPSTGGDGPSPHVDTGDEEEPYVMVDGQKVHQSIWGTGADPRENPGRDDLGPTFTERMNKIQDEIKEKWRHKIDPTLWDQIKSIPTASFLGIITTIFKDMYDVSEMKKDMALLEELGLDKGHPMGTDTAYSQLQDYFAKRKLRKPQEGGDGDGPEVPLPPTIQLLEDEMYASRDGMSAWEIIKANQARKAMLVAKGIHTEDPITDITLRMDANRGGLANLFRVKNQ